MKFRSEFSSLIQGLAMMAGWLMLVAPVGAGANSTLPEGIPDHAVISIVEDDCDGTPLEDGPGRVASWAPTWHLDMVRPVALEIGEEVLEALAGADPAAALMVELNLARNGKFLGSDLRHGQEVQPKRPSSETVMNLIDGKGSRTDWQELAEGWQFHIRNHGALEGREKYLVFESWQEAVEFTPGELPVRDFVRTVIELKPEPVGQAVVVGSDNYQVPVFRVLGFSSERPVLAD